MKTNCLLVNFVTLSTILSFANGALAEPSATTEPAAQQNKSFEGGVKGTVLLFDEGCDRIKTARELTQESATKIIKESTRKATVMMGGPNAIGNGIVIPAIGGTSGTMQMGELPIRRDKLNRFMNESEQSIDALQNYIDALQIPPENAERLKDTHLAMVTVMQDVRTRLANLKELSAARSLRNLKIAEQALKLYDDMTELEKQRKKLLTLSTSATSSER